MALSKVAVVVGVGPGRTRALLVSDPQAASFQNDNFTTSH